MKKYEYGNRDSSNILIQMVDDHDLAVIESEVSIIKDMAGDDFRLIALKVNDWNKDLSPWEAPPVFGNEGFGGGAEDTLAEVLSDIGDEGKRYFIGGYSLAGLFALWAAYRTDIFSGVAAASPSVWFPGFDKYMKDHAIRTDKVYLSLGDREERTRNQVMSTVGDRIREAHEYLTETGIDCNLEWNQGNHFRDADLRTAKAFAWVLNESRKTNSTLSR
ncbi:MAG: esterase [Firmicutes bacterium]|nr:esterase [Bacillota bacterium]